MKKFTDYIAEHQKDKWAGFKTKDEHRVYHVQGGSASSVGKSFDTHDEAEAHKRILARTTHPGANLEVRLHKNFAKKNESVEAEELTEATNEAKKHIEAMKFHKKKNKEHLANAHVGMESDKFHSQIEKATHHRDLYFTHRDAHNRLKGK